MAEKKNAFSGVVQFSSDALRGFAARMAERRAKLGQREFVRQVTYVIFLPIAGYTTWHGMYELIRFSTPNGGLLLWLGTVLVTVALFALMNLTIVMWRSFSGLVSRVTALALYIVTAGISVGFAFAFWWTGLYSHQLTERRTEMAARGITCFVSQAGNDLVALRTGMESIAEHSATQSNTEATAGGTCGYTTDGKPGARSRKRAADAAAAQDKLRNIRDLASGVTGELERLKTELSEISTDKFRTASSADRGDRIALINRSIAATGERLNAARTSEILDRYVESFELRINENRNGFRDGTTLYRCPDSTLEDNMLAAIGNIQRVKRTPDISKLSIPYIEEGRATWYAFQLYLNTMSQIIFGTPQTQTANEAARGRVAAAGGDIVEGGTDDCRVSDLEAIGDATPGVVSGTEWFVFFLAVFLDLGIAYAGITKPLDEDEQLRKEIERAQNPENAAVLELIKELQNSDAGLRGMVGPYHVTVFGEDYLIVPAHPEFEEEVASAPRAPYAVANLVALLEVARLAHEVTPTNPFLRNLLRRLELKKQAASERGPALLLKDEVETKPQGFFASMGQRLAFYISWLRREAIAFVSDEELNTARRKYNLFKVGRSMFKKLHLRSVAPGRAGGGKR